jgi:hypothetical protein
MPRRLCPLAPFLLVSLLCAARAWGDVQAPVSTRLPRQPPPPQAGQWFQQPMSAAASGASRWTHSARPVRNMVLLR